MILVVGASGVLGSRVARRLVEAGYPLKALSRGGAAKLAALRDAGVEAVSGDLRDKDSLERAVRGVNTVISCAHGLAPPSRKNTIMTVDRDGNRNLIDAARSAGVEHFLLTSIVFASPTCPCAFGRAKAAAEEHLRASGLPATILRPNAFMEAHVLQLEGEPLRAKGQVRIFGRGRTRMNFVAVDDVAAAMTKAVVEGPQGSGDAAAVASVWGPEDFTRLDTIALLERALGTKARVRHLPTPAVRLLRAVTRPIHPGISYLADASLMEDTHPEVFRPQPGEQRIVGETRLQDVIERWARGDAPD